MRNMRLTITLASMLIILSACSKGAPDIKNIDDLEKISKGAAGSFVIKTEDKEYSPSNYYSNFCMNSTGDKNCIAANDLFSAYKALPSKSVLGNN